MFLVLYLFNLFILSLNFMKRPGILCCIMLCYIIVNSWNLEQVVLSIVCIYFKRIM